MTANATNYAPGGEEQTILVAFNVLALTREGAEKYLLRRLPIPGGALSWWIAEDDRHDGSDNDSAVFVPLGRQHEASTILSARYGQDYNIVPPHPVNATTNTL